jgi:hypothetical protein
MIEATVETFAKLSGDGLVVVDIWGPQCQPCLALKTTTPDQIEQAIIRLLDGAPAVGPPVPEHLRNDR